MKNIKPVLVAALAASLTATALAQGRTDSPLQGGMAVTYKSPQGDASDLTIPAVLYKPADTAKGAVVIVGSTSTPTDFREGQYARAMSSAGYAVLAIDTLGPRGIVDRLDNAKLSLYAQARDVFAAKKYLVSIGYPADRMAAMGSGRGGTIALMVADRTFMQDEKDRFAAAMAVSAGCVFYPKAPKPAARLFIAIGDKDDRVGVQPCKDLARAFAAAGGQVDVKVYPGAGDDFDGNPRSLSMIRDPFGETYVDCKVPVESDGSSTYNGKTFSEHDALALFAEMRKSCTKRGVISWTNLTQKATVTFDMIDFLDANFRR